MLDQSANVGFLWQELSLPDAAGELNYGYLFDHIERIGYAGAVGVEYKPATTTDAGLSWIDELRKA